MNVSGQEEEQEATLREALDIELDTLVPGLAPTDAIVAQGRAIRRKRRERIWTLAASVAVIAALNSALLLRGTTPPSASISSDGWISVNPSAYDEANGLLGSGTISGKTWSISLSHPPLASTDPAAGRVITIQPEYDNQLTGTVAGTHSASRDISTSTFSAPKSNLLEGVRWFADDATNNPPYFFGVGPVAQNVGSVVAHYANGDSVSYPATNFEGTHFIALLAVNTTTIDKLTVYGTDGAELGYVDPISALGGGPQTDTSTWYTPNQPPAFAPATLTFTGSMFGAPKTPWTIDVQAGGFGVCEYTTPPEPFGGMACTPPGSQASKEPIDAVELGSGNPAVLVIGPLDPTVTRVTVTLTDGETVQLPFKRIDGQGICADVFAPGKAISTVTAYQSNGSIYAHIHWG